MQKLRHTLPGREMIRASLSDRLRLRGWAFLVFIIFVIDPARVAADSAPRIRARETVVIDAVGDARSRIEIKLPIALYTALKDRTRNTALLLRQIGLSHEEYYEVQDIQGEFDDGKSTLRFSWTTRGLARPHRDHIWEAPVDEGSGLEVMTIRDNMVLFTTAVESPFGVILLTLQVEVARGSTDLQLLHSPNRLAYRMPAATVGAGSRTVLDFEFQTKPQVMSCLAKSHGNPKFSKMWLARTVLKNTGDQRITDYRVRFRLRDHAAAWSSWQQVSDVVPGQSVVDAYFPIFDLEKIGRLSGSCRDTLELEYHYRRADGQLVEVTDSRTIQLLGRNEVYFSSRQPDDCYGWEDYFDFGPSILASFVTRDDPIIQQVAGWVSGQIGGVAASSSDEEAIKFLRALYEFMTYNRIAYQTPPGGEFNGKLGQHVKYGRDVLQNRAGTCIDLAILYGSVCEAVGLRPVLFLIPGHCFPAVRLPRSGNLYGVEVTGVGRATFNQVSERGQQEIKEAREKGPSMRIDIEQLHNAGVFPLQLPTLPATTLSDWGIHPVSAAAVAGAPATTRTAPAIPSWVVGAWKCDTNVNRVRVQMLTSFDSDGAYTAYLRYTDESGQFRAWAKEEGSFQVGAKAFTFMPSSGKAKDTPFSRSYVREDGYLWITISEIGYQLPFAKGPADGRFSDVAPSSTTPAAATSSAQASNTGRTIVPQQGNGTEQRGKRDGLLPHPQRGRKRGA
jgi:hypothetical protein